MRKSTAQCTSSAGIVPLVIAFLEKRSLDVPNTLRKASASHGAAAPSGTPSESSEFKWVLTLLGGLKERERRALARFVDKTPSGVTESSSASGTQPQACSEGEDEPDAPLGPPVVRGGVWPSGVRYTNDYVWSEDVPAGMRQQYRPATRARPARSSSRIFAAAITDPLHPACGQNGLFAKVPLHPGQWVVDYVGAVGLGEHQDKGSDYVCDFGEHSELALDANSVGNEGRFVNDYRNTGRHANVEFKLRRDRKGELRQGIFVCAKSRVAPGEELLISYGKSYWRSRVDGSMEDFIRRRPGEPAPPPPHTPSPAPST